MTFYTDETPPATWTGDLNLVKRITSTSGDTIAFGGQLNYALFEDTTTWDNWSAWAQRNSIHYKDLTWFSSRALQLTGTWADIGSGEKGVMCMFDGDLVSDDQANTGPGFCIELDESNQLYNTYRLTATGQAALCGKDTTPPTTSVTSLGCLADPTSCDPTTTTDHIVPVAIDAKALDNNFYGFQAFKCTRQTPNFVYDCLAWVMSDAGINQISADATALAASPPGQAEIQFSPVGYKNWKAGDKVTFVWFDPRADKPSVEANKLVKETVDLLTSVQSGAVSLASVATALALTVSYLLF